MAQELIQLTDLDSIPQLKNQPNEFKQLVIDAAESSIIDYCKRDLRSTTYTEYHSGRNTPYIITRQRPIISVTNVWLDAGGYGGQGTNPFASDTVLTAGVDYIVMYDKGETSEAGLIKRIGGFGQQYLGYIPENIVSGKLAGRKLPTWPRGELNIKVTYTAGYSPIPNSIKYAAQMLAAYMARSLPLGAPLSSESLGQYSYSVGQVDIGTIPELGTVRRALARYREPSFGDSR